jgi:hypothetical protein
VSLCEEVSLSEEITILLIKMKFFVLEQTTIATTTTTTIIIITTKNETS